MGVASTQHPVVRIVLRGPEHQVVEPDAWLVVAKVVDLESIRDDAAGKLENDVVGPTLASVDRDLAVPVLIPVTGPGVAPVWRRSPVHPRPERRGEGGEVFAHVVAREISDRLALHGAVSGVSIP